MDRVRIYGNVEARLLDKRPLMEQLSRCKVIPSSFTVATSDDSFCVVANGSSYLYLIGSEKVVRILSFHQKHYSFHFVLQVAIRFGGSSSSSLAVCHVSSLSCVGSQQLLALCCLSNGAISALSIQSVLAAAS